MYHVMNILVDQDISFAEEAFSKFGSAKLIHGRKTSNSVLKDANVLVVRSNTKVNEDLNSNF